MNQQKKVRIGLIGVGSRLRFVISDLCEGIEVAGIYDPHPESIAAAKAQYGEKIKIYSSDLDLIQDPTIDWVCVGSWNSQHKAQAIAALNAGKNLFCEKPLAINFEDCLAVRDALHASKGRFFFGLVLRFSPLYQKIKEIIDSGVLGKIASFEFNETLDLFHGGYIMGGWRRFQKNAGTHMLEKCCHDLDVANWMLDSVPQRVASFGGLNTFKQENTTLTARFEGKEELYWKGIDLENPFKSQKDIVDTQVVILEYQNGVKGVFHTNCNTGIPERRMYLCGLEGTLRADARTGVVEWQKTGVPIDTPPFRWEAGIKGSHAGSDEFMRKNLYRVMLTDEIPTIGIEESLQSAISAFGIDQALNEGEIISLKPYWDKLINRSTIETKDLS